jgi:hypothetical protein
MHSEMCFSLKGHEKYIKTANFVLLKKIIIYFCSKTLLKNKRNVTANKHNFHFTLLVFQTEVFEASWPGQLV